MVSPERVDSMQNSWVKLLERYRVTAAEAYPVFDVLVAAYSAKERYYHNLEHLTEMFRVTSRLALDVSDMSALQLAIWFHDAVYDPRAKDNEARSAELAVDLLGPIGVPASTIERVVRLVQATAHLNGNDFPADRDTAILLDADLAILGSAENRYARYADEIRKEYSWVPEQDYRKLDAKRDSLLTETGQALTKFTRLLNETKELLTSGKRREAEKNRNEAKGILQNQLACLAKENSDNPKQNNQSVSSGVESLIQSLVGMQEAEKHLGESSDLLTARKAMQQANESLKKGLIIRMRSAE